MPDTRYAAGSGAALFLQTLTKQGAVTQAPVITTTNNGAASVTVSTPLPSQVVLSETFAVTPRINSDDSVTLALHPVLLDGTVKREINTLRTVKSGDTMVFVMAPNARTVGGTPTISTADSSRRHQQSQIRGARAPRPPSKGCAGDDSEVAPDGRGPARRRGRTLCFTSINPSRPAPVAPPRLPLSSNRHETKGGTRAPGCQHSYPRCRA